MRYPHALSEWVSLLHGSALFHCFVVGVLVCGFQSGLAGQGSGSGRLARCAFQLADILDSPASVFPAEIPRAGPQKQLACMSARLCLTNACDVLHVGGAQCACRKRKRHESAQGGPSCPAMLKCVTPHEAIQCHGSLPPIACPPCHGSSQPLRLAGACSRWAPHGASPTPSYYLQLQMQNSRQC